MKKLSVIVLTFVMTLGLFAVAGFAATINGLEATVDRVGKTVAITGSIDSGEGKEVTIRVFKPNGSDSYVSQTTSSANGSFTFSYSLAESPEGTYSVDVGGDDVSLIASTTFVFDTAAPTITNLSGDHADDIVRDADTVVVTATFNEAMASAPTVKIDYADTTPDVNMAMTQGINATTWTYSWDVPVGNTTATVTVAGADVAGNAYAGANNLVYTIDNTSPTATIGYSDLDGKVKDGDSLTITATFSEELLDNPPVQIAISGANTVSATAMTKTSATVYTYTYTVGAGNGAATVALSVGTDVAGNVVASAPTNGATFTVDNTAPTAEITYSKEKVKVGDSLTITATFSESLLDNPPVEIAISGANAVDAIAMIKTSATVYTYTYIVEAGNGAATVALSVGTDVAGNVVASAPTNGATFTVDNTAPTITNLSDNHADDIVRDADTVVVTATFNEAMASAPTVKIDYADTTPDLDMAMTQGIDATTWTYSWDVPVGNTIATVTVVGADVAGNAYAGANNLVYTIDNTSPTATIGYSDLDGKVKDGDSLTITATFSEELLDNPPVQIAISGANIVSTTAMTKTSTTVYKYTYTAGIGNGAATVALSVGTDVAGNVVASAPTSGATFTVDNTAPMATITTAIVNANYNIETAQSGELGTIYLVPQNGYANTVALDAVVTAGNGTKIDVSTANTNTTIVAPAKSGDYKLYAVDEVGNISEASIGTITVRKFNLTAIFTDSAGDGINALTGNTFINSKLSARNNQATGINQDMMLIIALYRQNGSMQSVAYGAQTIDGQVLVQLNAGFDLPVNTTGYAVKTFVWDGLNISGSSMVPLSNVQIIQ